MADVKWIKLIVGMFDGESFKRIKRAKIGGESYRDKLTAVWFELMDFAGKCNHDGMFINSAEIPYKSLDDIAMMIDRETDELQLCMQFYINAGMIEIIDDVYHLSNWDRYQNTEGLDRIRENNRIRNIEYRQRKKEQKLLCDDVRDITHDITVMSYDGTDIDIDTDKEKDKNKKIDKYFDEFWKVYPKKVGKDAARRAFDKVRKKTDVSQFPSIIEKQKKSKQWTKDNGQYIPNPTTWLNQGRWEDELTTSASKPSGDRTAEVEEMLREFERLKLI